MRTLVLVLALSVAVLGVATPASASPPSCDPDRPGCEPPPPQPPVTLTCEGSAPVGPTVVGWAVGCLK